MAVLHHLADEIIQLILTACTAPSCASPLPTLFLCGSKALNARLSRCCLTFEAVGAIRNDQPTLELHSWPSLAAEFKGLTSFVIYARNIDESRSQLTSSIQQLPASLTRLELSFSDANLLPLTEAEAEDEFDPFFSAEQVMWDIGKSFPKLQTMKFVSTDPEPFRPTVYASCLPCLPPHLTSLTWNVLLELDQEELLLLSRDFKRIDVACFNTAPWTPESLAMLPPHLEYLGGASLGSEDLVKHLPRTLTGGDYHLPQITPTFLADLPPNTRYLNGYMKVAERLFGPIFVTWPELLPPTLTELALDHTVTASEIFRFPKTITRMTHVRIVEHTVASWVRQDLGDGVPLWPPNLTSISFYELRFGTSSVAATSLPPTLTELYNWYPRYVRSIDFSTKAGPVMPSLHTVSFKGSAYHSEDPYALTDDMPNSITDANFSDRALSPVSFQHLSRSLVILDIPGTGTHSPEVRRFIADLPRSLRQLSIATIHAYCLSMLPPGLTVLSTNSIHGVVTKEAISGLPRLLKRLRFHRRVTEDEFDLAAFQALPSLLKHLDLGKNPCDLTILQYLPTTIRYLHATFEIRETSPTPVLPFRWLKWLAHHSSSFQIRRFVTSNWPQGAETLQFRDAMDE